MTNTHRFAIVWIRFRIVFIVCHEPSNLLILLSIQRRWRDRHTSTRVILTDWFCVNECWKKILFLQIIVFTILVQFGSGSYKIINKKTVLNRFKVHTVKSEDIFIGKINNIFCKQFVPAEMLKRWKLNAFY